MHVEQNITAIDKFTFEVNLWNRQPFRKFRDTYQKEFRNVQTKTPLSRYVPCLISSSARTSWELNETSCILSIWQTALEYPQGIFCHNATIDDELSSWIFIQTCLLDVLIHRTSIGKYTITMNTRKFFAIMQRLAMGFQVGFSSKCFSDQSNIRTD